MSEEEPRKVEPDIDPSDASSTAVPSTSTDSSSNSEPPLKSSPVSAEPKPDPTEPSPPDGFQLFNEDIVCPHHQLDSQAPKLYLPQSSYDNLLSLVGEDVHPATVLDDFQSCTDCQSVLDATESACEKGAQEKNLLSSLFADKKRPSFTKDAGLQVYLLDRDFYDEWRTFVRSCARGKFIY